MMSPADGEGGQAFGAARVGAELRAARNRLGWALPDVAATLRIRLPYLQAIEDGRVADLPGNTYAVGFLRTYASAHGLDAAEAARRFRAEAQEVNRKTELEFPAPVPQRGVPVGAVVLLGLLLTAGAYVAWYRMSGDTRTAAEVVPAVPDRLAPLADRALPPSNLSPQVASILPPPPPPVMPAPAGRPAGLAAVAPAAPVADQPALPPAPAAPPPPAAVPAPTPDVPHLLIRATSDAWIQVRERQGAVLLSRLMRGGESWPVPRGVKLLMTTGNAGGTELVVDGVAAPPLGPSGALRRDVPLDSDAAIAPRSAPQ